MRGETPAYRGALCHAALAAVTADARHGARVLAAIDPIHLSTIRSASRLAWVHAEALDQLNATYLRAAGADCYVDFWRRYTIGATDSTLLGSFFQCALRIFGRSPAGLMKWVGRAWEVTTRDYGRAVVLDRGDAVCVRLEGIPAQCRHVTVPLTTQASLTAIIEFVEFVPEVSCDLRRFATEGTYDVVARWSTRPSG